VIEYCGSHPRLSQAYKHIFTSPSSVDKEPKATRSGNARIHGMTQVTLPSIAYVATQVFFSILGLADRVFNPSQVRFALTSSPVFSRTDTVTDSETFYTSVLDLLEDEDEKEEVKDLIVWWNRYRCTVFSAVLSDCLILLIAFRQIFPNYSAAKRPIPRNSVLAKIREKRALLRSSGGSSTSGSQS
jgi:hypothetical protein